MVYKSEAFEKFQILLYRLKFDVTAYIAGIDFSMVQQQDQASQVVMANSQSEAEYLKMLQKVSAEVQEIKPTKSVAKESEKMVYKTSDGVEIFEVNDTNQPIGTPTVFDVQSGDKVRPNDPCPCGSGKKYKKCH
ncbi:MAG: SEC-C metal-binding domain-containing protein [bacterium]